MSAPHAADRPPSSWDVTVDAHTHVWNRATDPQPWIDPVTMSAIDRDFSLADLARELDGVGAARAVVVQSINTAAETARLLDAANECVAGVVGWLDLTGDVDAQLDGIASGALVGVRHLVHIDPDPMWLARADARRGIAAIGRAGLTFDVVARCEQLPVVTDTAGVLPDVRIVLDHLGNPPYAADARRRWEHDLRAFAGLPNTVAKLSGVVTALGQPEWTLAMCREVFDVALDCFGPDRLMYGSDWPVVELDGGMARWHAAAGELVSALSPAERAAIAGGTATAVYGLG